VVGSSILIGCWAITPASGSVVDFAYTLPGSCTTPRTLRELMSLRTAQLAQSRYEWQQHRIMACDAGVPEEQVAALENWQHSSLFDARERAALAPRKQLWEDGWLTRSPLHVPGSSVPAN
jgi:hypothetical protein